MRDDNLYRQCPSGTVPYRVIEGETLFIIARKFNTTVNAITAANPGINPQNIYGGLQLCVPQVQPPAQPPGSTCPIGTAPYEIKRGDTLANIAGRFNTSVSALMSANPGIDPNRLQIGQTICVAQRQPQYPPCSTMNFYVIREGDTLYSIARAFNTTLQELTRANPTINPNNLYDGLVICIPLTPSPLSITVSKTNKVLTLYRQGRFVKSYPVAVGKPSTPTPSGTFTIVNKQVDPGGPFGTRWLGLSEPHYGIHGNNNPASIGTAASNGCVRMRNPDVEELFNEVGVGTIVRIF